MLSVSIRSKVEKGAVSCFWSEQTFMFTAGIFLLLAGIHCSLLCSCLVSEWSNVTFFLAVAEEFLESSNETELEASSPLFAADVL